MSIRLMSVVFAADLPDVAIPVGEETHNIKASTAKFVLLALADHTNDEGRGAYPSLDTLARKTSMSRRTVQRALDALIQLKIIQCVGVSEYGTDNYTIYEHAISRGDSGTKATEGMTLVQVGVTLGQGGDDSGALKCVPESPESSFKPSIKSKKTHSEKPNFVSLTVQQAAALPEIRVYHETTGMIPGSGQWETVWQTIRGMNGKGDPEYLRPFWLAWTAKGYRPNNLDWLTEWAVSGEIPAKQKSAPKMKGDRSDFLAALERA